MDMFSYKIDMYQWICVSYGPSWPNWQRLSINSDNALAPNSCPAIIWTNDGLSGIYIRHWAAMTKC